jgi:hypothetical protein
MAVSGIRGRDDFAWGSKFHMPTSKQRFYKATRSSRSRWIKEALVFKGYWLVKYKNIKAFLFALNCECQGLFQERGR